MFAIVPMTFLSGVFYSVHSLPPFWQQVSHLNPFFYMIDGFRYGFIGVSDGTLGTGLITLAVCNLFLLLVSYRMFATGYKTKF